MSGIGDVSGDLGFYPNILSLQQKRLQPQFSRNDLVLFSSLLIVLMFITRRLFSRAQIEWHYAALPVKLRFPDKQVLDFSQVCKSVTSPCYLHPLVSNRHLQTIFFMLRQQKFALYFRRLVFQSEDPDYEGTFAVDFSTPAFLDHHPELPPKTAYYSAEAREQMPSADSRPMLVVLHGLSGGSHEQYLQHAVAPLVGGRQKWEACVILSRGCGESTITGGGMYYAHATSDIRQVVTWLRKTFPNRPLYAAGFSMGGNILTRYIAEEGENCVFKAAVVVSNPWNLELAALNLQRTTLGRWLYSPAMTANLMNIFSRHYKKIKTTDGTVLDMETASHVHLMHEYDRYIQCPTWGFPTERVYYRQASSCDAVLDVRVPFLAINAEDDPIVGPDAIPKGEFHASPYTVLCTTDSGGHLGWLLPDGNRWYACTMVSFFRKMHQAL